VATTADNESTTVQHTGGNLNKKPKADAAEGEQKPEHEPSATQGVS
jgi:hypothetical protein